MPIDFKKIDNVAAAIAGLVSAITDLAVDKPKEANPYEILGVQPTDSMILIDLIYKARAKVLHPDKGGNEEEFKRLVAAYEQIKSERGES